MEYLSSVFMEYYQWLKAVHIMSIIAWMAGLLYLPRLFVYHSENRASKEFVQVVKLQEYRLFAYIMRPAMLASIITGAMLIIANTAVFKSGMWIHIKLTLVVLLLIFHIACGVFASKMQRESCELSPRFFRVFNEIPTLLMIGIVLCAVLKF